MRSGTLAVLAALGLLAGPLAAAAVAAAGDEDLAAARKGCEAGTPADCQKLGLAHLQGRGVRKSMPDAIAYLGKACDGGGAAGCSTLATLYRAGRGVAKDEKVAASLSERGCDGGDPFGCMALSFSVADRPLGTPRAVLLMGRSANLAQEACDAGRPVAGPDGEVSACSLLGSLYDEGWGVPKDAKRAADLFKQACDGGSILGCEDLERARK